MRQLIILLSIILFINTSVAAQEDRRPVLGTTTIIKAILTQKLVSDYTGPFRGYVTHDVYDTSHEYILIPVGSKILGEVVRVSNVNEPISARVGYLITSIIRPDSVVIDFTNDAAVDHEGVSGVKDKVNRHLLAQFFGVTAYALISSSVEGNDVNGLTGTVDVSADVEEKMREQFAGIASKYLNLIPTITIRSGQTFNIFNQEPKKLEPFGSIYDDFLP